MPNNVKCEDCANLKQSWCELVNDSPDENIVRDCDYFALRVIRCCECGRYIYDERIGINRCDLFRAVFPPDWYCKGAVPKNETRK